MGDEPDYYDPRNPVRRSGQSAPSEPPPPPAGASAPTDPRSPVRKVLDLYELDSERNEGLDKALIAAAEEAAAGDIEGAIQHAAEAVQTYGEGGVPAPAAPSVTASAGGADAQISMPRVPFHDWHLSLAAMPAEFDVPVRIPVADVVAVTVPAPGSIPDEAEDSDSGPPSQEESWWTRFWRELRELESKGEHAASVANGVKDRVAKIQAARALMPVISEGTTAGTLQKVKYTTIIGGRASTDSGWMFQEPTDTDYGKWFAGQMKKQYTDAAAAWKAMPDTDAGKKKLAWGAVGNAATCIAIAGQEAAPSGINTYDGRVLSWGIGLAAPGHLQKVMHFIVQDPKVSKVFYCCGFSYGCDIRAVKGEQDQYHGIYQTVDLTKEPPGIVYGDNFHHRTIPRKQKKGEFHGNGYLALKPFVAQLELIYMLIQVARDPETRETVFKHNYNFIKGAANVKGFTEISSEALYVFTAQVQHNWGIASKDPIGYAISTMDAAERALPRPSADADKAIAKGVARLVAKVLQEQKFQNAVKALRTGKYSKGMTAADPIWKFPAVTEWGPKRLLEHYWDRLQKGERSQDGSKVEVPGFMVPVTSVPAGNYQWRERDGSVSFDLGPASRMSLRFEHDDFVVTAVRADGKVEVTDLAAGATRVEDPAPR